jgi:predicted short-subunit dehydrogenase-like oxidoreductase (DUF2520 family)
MKQRVLVIGPGRVGKCLALVHQQDGALVQLLGRRPGEWQQWAVTNQIEALLDTPSTGTKFDMVLLAVADEQLQAAIQQCMENDLVNGAVVVHLSGAFGDETLTPVKAATAATAAVHPLMAFSGSAHQDSLGLKSSVVTIDCDEQNLSAVSSLVNCWHARQHCLPAGQDRASYHLALSLLANHITAITAWAQELLQPALGEETAGLIRAMSGQAVASTLEQGGMLALTGPVVRGDVGTVQAHLESLSADQADRYRGALIAVIDLAAASGRLNPAKEAQLRALTSGPQSS